MVKRMLIDATHPEETRVVVVSGKRLEEFDFETTSKKQLKGNIYLAKVTRVEPSLQAAFVDYGGNRHGFLAFSEIHPDYYRIPVADREALLAEEAALGAAAEDSDPEDPDSEDPDEVEDEPDGAAERTNGSFEDLRADLEPEASEAAGARNGQARGAAAQIAADRLAGPLDEPTAEDASGEEPPGEEAVEAKAPETLTETLAETWPGDSGEEEEPEPADEIRNGTPGRPAEDRANGEARSVETVGGDEIEDVAQPRRARTMRRYKIQEVIKRRQIMLVQVTKEERGNKGAALTTYLSLAGRYCVLMPNTARGGGVSRKITNPADRKRLKSIIEELEIPEGMAVIVRTAGSERSKAEIRRDYEYLLRLWDEIRELTLKSTAPALIYEEANLIKRSIRDLYSRDIEDILVEGEEGYKLAKAFMRTLTPSHAKRVQLYKNSSIPLFHRYQVEGQLDAIHNPVVQLKSGGYIVINPTEALVAIDVNSGRATRERNIEETALRTNLEAAEEIARQLRLRDLAGLIVIDFIDMEEARHNAQVERRLKEAMRNDRARIQLGHISPFGLLELSRQRLRPSLVEASTEMCPRCRGIGYIRSTESTALHVLRSIEEEGIRSRSAAITVEVPTAVALYILNQKRRTLAEIEMRHGLRVFLTGDDTLVPPDFRIERMKTLAPDVEGAHPINHVSAPLLEEEFEEAEPEEAGGGDAAEAAEETGEQRSGRRRRPRRRRRRDESRPEAEAGEAAAEAAPAAAADTEEAGEGQEGEGQAEESAAAGAEGGEEQESGRRRRRRGRRGGRRRGRRGESAVETEARSEEAGPADAAEHDAAEPRGPEPTDPMQLAGQAAGDAVTIPIVEAHQTAELSSDGSVAEAPIEGEPATAPEAVPSEPPAPSETAEAETAEAETAEAELQAAIPASTAGEPTPQPEPPAEPEEPLARPESEARTRAAAEPEAPTPAADESTALQPDEAHRTEPAPPLSEPTPPSEPTEDEGRSRESISYLPLPASSPDERKPEAADEDHRPPSNRAESVEAPRRRGWWQRHAE